ncbi:MAG TPA: hypothetical protein VMF69_00425 [Gemmataceae bacterium]|nr:hypothetical protein [Gemmataceae bacterium]
MPPIFARSLAGIALLAILSTIVAAEPRADDKKKPAKAPNIVKGKGAEKLVLLKLEVDALEKLYHLELNAKQLASLLTFAEKTAAKVPAPQEAQASVTYYNVLKSLHDALLAQAEDRIRELSDTLDELQDKETISIDDSFEMTDAALLAAPKAFRLLSAAQVVAYLAAMDDEVPDPVERILSALEEGAELNGDEWKELRDETAEEVSWLAAGFNAAKTGKVKKDVADLLDRGHRFPGNELTKQWSTLEKDAHQLVADVSSLDVLQHYVERELAELLSNPRTVTVLRLWIKQLKAQTDKS